MMNKTSKRTVTHRLLVAGVLIACCTVRATTTAAAADETNPHVWRPRTTSVAVFKNGLGFFMREGDVELRDGWSVADKVPPAAFGTLAIYSHTKDEVVDIVGSGPGEIVDFDGIDAPDTDEFKRGRLESSLQLRLQLTYAHKGNDRSAAGVLVSVGPEFAILEEPSQSFAVPIAGISRMQLLDLPVRVHVSAAGGKKTSAKTKLGMAYLRKGITWIPEYTLRILDDETAELTLRGTLVNEAEDLIHCDVNFVVGVPHFVHTEYLAPIAVGQIIRTIGAAVAPPQIRTQIMNRAALANTIAANQFRPESDRVVEQPAGADGGNLDAAIANLPRIEGAAATDYAVYTKHDMTVRLGEKAIVTLFTKKIRYRHVYGWEPPRGMQHFLSLQNGTDTPWTTGPCLAVSSSQPLGEDLLKYTPRGGQCRFPVTTAVNIAHKHSEREVERKLKAHSPSHNYFLDLVTLEGSLTMRNFEKRTARIEVMDRVSGKPVSVTDRGAMTVDTDKLKLTERSGSVKWNFTLEPGETKTLTYLYERYVPSK